MGNLSEPSERYVLCRVCAHLIQAQGQDIPTCAQCGHVEHRMVAANAQMTLAFSLTAMILYIPANLFPFMTVELYGNRNSSTIMGGVLSLMQSGSIAIALIVFLASVLIPIVKLVILFYLSLTAHQSSHRLFKTKLHHFVETIGRWSMLDIFLLAVLVAIMKLGHFATVKPEVGAVIFAGVVIFTMLASAYFDPKLLWKEEHGKTL